MNYNCIDLFCFFLLLNSKDHLSTEIHQCPDFISSDRIIIETPEKQVHEKCNFCSQVVKNRLEMIKCDHCQSNFCLSHRHPEGHKCLSITTETKKTPSAFQLITSATSSSSSSSTTIKSSSLTPKGPKGAKNDSLAKKVALMKLKQSAIGLQSIPQTERLYFNLNLGNQTPCKPIYLSSFWSIGKSIDFIAEKLNLTNNNNKPDQPKLIITTEIEQTLPFDLTLAQLVELGSIETGQTLFIKYIDPIKG